MCGGKRHPPEGTQDDMADLVPFQEGNESWPLCYPYRQGGHRCEEQLPGMPFLNLKEVEAEVALCPIQDTIETIQNNIEGFTKREVEGEKAACKAQGMLGHLTDCTFLGMVCSNMLSNCSITEDAVQKC
jgi:hypothetical protein